MSRYAVRLPRPGVLRLQAQYDAKHAEVQRAIVAYDRAEDGIERSRARIRLFALQDELHEIEKQLLAACDAP